MPGAAKDKDTPVLTVSGFARTSHPVAGERVCTCSKCPKAEAGRVQRGCVSPWCRWAMSRPTRAKISGRGARRSAAANYGRTALSGGAALVRDAAGKWRTGRLDLVPRRRISIWLHATRAISCDVRWRQAFGGRSVAPSACANSRSGHVVSPKCEPSSCRTRASRSGPQRQLRRWRQTRQLAQAARSVRAIMAGTLVGVRIHGRARPGIAARPVR